MANNIQLIGKEELLAKLESLGNLDAAKAGLMAAGLYLKGRLSVYPQQQRLTRESVYGSAFKTPRQRRAFFAKLRSGEIQVPYHRGTSPNSERFKAAWTAQAENDGMSVVIGNDTSYGPMLMGDDTQSIYMRRVGWRKVGEIVDEERDVVVGMVSDALDTAVEE